MDQTLPETCQVALKEWSGICDALRTGRQTLLLRKGGIAEEAGQFRPDHEAFWLYPTKVHQQVQGLKWPVETTAPGPVDTVTLEALAVVTAVAFIDREEVLDELDPWHAWTDETIRSRFHYRRPGLWALAVRIFDGGSSHTVAVTPEHEGCKSWVTLEEPLSTFGLHPVVEDDDYQERIDAIRRAIGSLARS